MHTHTTSAYGFVDNPPMLRDIELVISYLFNDGLGQDYNMELVCQMIGQHRKQEFELRKASTRTQKNCEQIV